MLVSNLQQFIRLLVPPLTAAGINATAEKSVASSLEALATALDPFKDLRTDQLAELLGVAEEYRRTGQIPAWVASRPASAPRPRAPKAPKVTPTEAVAKLRDLQGRAVHLDPDRIAEEVRALQRLTVKDLQVVQRDFLGATVGKKKDEILASLRKKIDDYRESRERADGILAG